MTLRLLRVVALILAVAAAGELGLRDWYRRLETATVHWPMLYEQIYWPTPWRRASSILARDPALGAWMRPRIVRTYLNLFGPLPDVESVDRLLSDPTPEVPAWARERPVWTLRTNSEGMRGGEIEPKDSGSFRIAAIGDSWTVGVNVGEEDSYPSVLGRLLSQRGRRVEVLNFGRIGASGEAAAETLRRKVRPHAPDLVVLAFGQNDEPRLQGARREGPGILRRALERSELLRFGFYALDSRRNSILAALEDSARNSWAVADNAPGACTAPAVADSAFARAMEEAVAEARARGAAVILLYAAVPEGRHCAREALSSVAARTGAPLVDGAALLAAEGRRREAALADRLRLSRAPKVKGLLLRAYKPGALDGALRVRLAASGDGWAWRDLGPLRDDGLGVDERARDGVHSLLAPLADGQDAAWFLREGAEGTGWAGVENYVPRRWRLAEGSTPPVAEFGRRTLRSDPFHADADGYAILARALAAAIQAEPAFRNRN